MLDVELEALERAGILREPSTGQRLLSLAEEAERGGRTLINVSSNDYLGYATRNVSRETLDACTALPLGSGASRLLGGSSPVHDQLEQRLAQWVRKPSALLFSSGYAANVGTIAALAQPGDLVVSDALNHASLIDGCRLSRARIVVTPHRDLDAVETALRRSPERRRWVVTESYFSMDADSPDLPSVRGLCDRLGAILVVDEAHALGVFGPAGSGLCCQAGIVPDVLIGTLGKAVGSQGAFVATDMTVRTWLWNRARSFVFSTGISPLLAALTQARVMEVQADDAARARLCHSAETLTAALRARQAPLLPNAHGPVLPLIFGTPERAVAASQYLLHNDVFALPIRPPTVPEGTARLRISLTADLAASDLSRLLEVLTAETLFAPCKSRSPTPPTTPAP